MKPILFNTSMVQAILDGRKTTTRRLFKDLKEFEIRKDGFIQADIENKNGIYYFAGDIQELSKQFSKYKEGDILYVRETWTIQSMKNYEKNVKFLYKAKPQELKEVNVSEERYNDLLKFECKNGWQPSLFMPKEAARIFLKVTSVKVERLQDITNEECLKEGIREYTKDGELIKYSVNDSIYKWQDMPREPREAFKDLWNSTLNKKSGWIYAFENNPWVWVYEFERISKEEALNESNSK